MELTPPDDKNFAPIFERLLEAQSQPLGVNQAIDQDVAAIRQFDDTMARADPIYRAQIARLQSNIPLSIEAGTVGAYLFGCLTPSSVVEVACTPECVTGLSNPEMVPCDLVSYQKHNHKLVRLNTKTTEDANVFIQAGQNLTSEDHAQLFLDGVRVITLFHQQAPTINYKLGKSMVVMPTNVPTLIEPETISATSETTDSQEWWWWALVIVILVFLIIIAVIF